MSELKKWIKRLFCNHDFNSFEFAGTVLKECKKCGEIRETGARLK